MPVFLHTSYLFFPTVCKCLSKRVYVFGTEYDVIIPLVYKNCLMKTSNKAGGRPPKPLNERHQYQVNVKFKTEEYYTLKSKAKTAQMPINDFVRSCIKNNIIKPRISPEENVLIRDLRNMGNNLNQIAKRANQAGFESIKMDYFRLAESISTIINRIINGSQDS